MYVHPEPKKKVTRSYTSQELHSFVADHLRAGTGFQNHVQRYFCASSRLKGSERLPLGIRVLVVLTIDIFHQPYKQKCVDEEARIPICQSLVAHGGIFCSIHMKPEAHAHTHCTAAACWRPSGGQPSDAPEEEAGAACGVGNTSKGAGAEGTRSSTHTFPLSPPSPPPSLPPSPSAPDERAAYEHAKQSVAQQKGPPFFQRSVAHFKPFQSLVICLSLNLL